MYVYRGIKKPKGNIIILKFKILEVATLFEKYSQLNIFSVHGLYLNLLKGEFYFI